MKTFVYCRIASANSHLLASETLEGQEKTCREYARQNSYSVVKVYKDIGLMHSGVFLPEMRNLLRDILKEKHEIFVISDTDLRLGYKYPTKEKVKRLIKKYGGHFEPIAEETSRTNAFLIEETINEKQKDIEL